MRLTNIPPIKSLDVIPGLKPLKQTNTITKQHFLSEVEIILYSSNLCLFSMRILRNEIQIKNRNEVLNMVTNEVGKLYNQLSKKDMLLYSSYTKKNTREFFKKVGLKPKHIKTK